MRRCWISNNPVMDQLRSMRVFVKVVELGGLAAAARALDLAPSVVTRLVADLEDRLGARLLNRTTRRLTLTDIGSDYLQRAQQILHDIDEADALASDATRQPRGEVRLLLPPAVSVHQVVRHLPRFCAQYPLVSLALTANGPVEVPDDSFDISILWTRNVPDGDFVARLLARSETIVCASPDYLARKGVPQHPSDLAQHDGMVPPVAALQNGLRFWRPAAAGSGKPAEELTVMPQRALLRSTHVDSNYAAALAGLGIAGLPSYVVDDALASGRLVRVLADWQLFHVQLWAAMPSRKHVPARTRALMDFLLSVFGGEDRDPWLARMAPVGPAGQLPLSPAATSKAAPAPAKQRRPRQID